MKKIAFTLTLFCSTLLSSEFLLADTITQERYDKVCRYGVFNPPECKKKVIKIKRSNTGISNSGENTQRQSDPDCRFGLFNPPKCRGNDSRVKNKSINNKEKKKLNKQDSILENGIHDIALYTGTFDIIDKEGDDKTTLLGIEHKNENLFRDTWLGKFTPTTGAFVTGKSSLYLYSGVEAQYNLGPLSISPSFAPGYYEKGGGKDLGSVLEFKSEVKIGLDILENSNIGYSYSHISNNDWGDRNPGTDNQQITFSKNF